MIRRAFVLLSLLTCTLAHAGPVRVGDAEAYRIETEHPYVAGVAGEAAWRRVVHWPDASYIAVHFESFALAPGDRVEISHPQGARTITYTGKGNMDLGTFWSGPIPGDTAIVTLHATSRSPAAGFVIDLVAHGYPRDQGGGGPEDVCGPDDDTQEAQCYETTEPDAYDHSRPVARLLLNGIANCTGWLVGSEGHLLTNNHCIADNTDLGNSSFEFLAESTCATDCSFSGGCPGTIFTGTASLVTTDDECDLDYTLIKLSPDPTPTYGYLTLRSAGAVVGEQIYIAGHPAGWGKRISLASDDPADAGGVCRVAALDELRCDPSGTCDDFGGPEEVGYNCDTRGGSSGSPVLRYTLGQVVALHHCSGCPNRGERIQDVITDLGASLPLSAVARGDHLGQALAACDFNGDGETDLAIGVPEENVGAIENAGFVNVLYGAPGGLQTTAPVDQGISQNSVISGGAVEGASQAGDLFGSALAAGDFDGDGFCDLAIGVPGESIGSTAGAGFVNVLYGRANGLQTLDPPDQGISQNSSIGGGNVEGSSEKGDHFAAALVAGDFNGDGFDDLAVGAPGESITATTEDAGWVNVLYGGAAGLQTTAPLDQGISQNSSIGGGAVEDSAERGDHFAAALATGDFNEDGFDDLAVGVPDENVVAIVDAGMVNVLYGGAAGLQTTAPADQGIHQDSTIGGGDVEGTAEEGDHFGKALAAGDFDDNGDDDLAVGVPEEDIGEIVDAGFVNVLYGAGGIQTTAPADAAFSQDTVLAGGAVEDTAEESDGFGSALAVGDFDLNGDDDLAIGVPEENVGAVVDAGFVNLLYGSNGLQTIAPADEGWSQNTVKGGGAVEDSCEKGDRFGSALVTGDFDGLLFSDLVVGVPNERVGAAVVDAGMVNVLYGNGNLQTIFPADQALTQNSVVGAGPVEDSAE